MKRSRFLGSTFRNRIAKPAETTFSQVQDKLIESGLLGKDPLKHNYVHIPMPNR